MTNTVRIMIEPGTKTKRVVAVAFDWPGWERPGKDDEHSLEVMELYRPRYRRVAELAGLAEEFDAAGELNIVEHTEPSTNPDFFGISGKPASVELEPMSEETLERKMALLQACWQYFDETHPQISETLKKGPRGGGKDRNQVVRHTYGSEIEYSRKVNVRTELADVLTPDGLAAHRQAFLEGIRRVHAGERTRSKWPLALTIRRCCYHMLDHAWELEDKNLA